MQVIWCLKFCNKTKSRGDDPPLQILKGTCPPRIPVIYAHVTSLNVINSCRNVQVSNNIHVNSNYLSCNNSNKQVEAATACDAQLA